MAEKLYYSMGEVAEMFDVRPSLLRHWESQFGVLKPKRNKKGNRLFTPADIENLKLIYHLVKEQGMTLEGARKALRQCRREKEVPRDVELLERLQRIRALLVEVREELKEPAASQGRTVLVDSSVDASAELPTDAAEMAHGEAPEEAAAEQGAPVAAEAGTAAEAATTVEAETAAPKRRRRAKPVVKFADTPEGGTPAEAEAGTEASAQTEPGAPKRTARRPRRGKKEEAEHKELFAFYEQSLF